jgi:hypothetical protein
MRPARLAMITGTCLLLAVVSGCGTKKPTAPESSMVERSSARGADAGPSGASAGFYPLVAGNRWDFLYRFSVDTVGPGSYTYENRIREELTCRETHEGREYLVARRTSSDPQVGIQWIQYRQDRDGLYEWDDPSAPSCDAAPPPPPKVGRDRAADLSWHAAAARLGVPESSEPWRNAWARLEGRRASVASMARRAFSSAPVDLAPGEIRRLQYPLHPGGTWDIRPDPHFWSEVEGAVSLVTPAGRFHCWAIRWLNEALGPQDVVVAWFGRDGYLGYRFRFREVVTDQQGDPIGTLAGEQSETLIGISLVGHGASAADR